MADPFTFDPDAFPLPPDGYVFVVGTSSVQLMALERSELVLDSRWDFMDGSHRSYRREPAPITVEIRGRVRDSDNRARTRRAIDVAVTVVENSSNKQLPAPKRALRPKREDQ